MMALTTPTCGISSKIWVKTSDEAVTLKTIGRKMTVLKAVAQRMRSVSTASTRPIMVTTKGKTRTQMTLLRNAIRVSAVVNKAL